MQSEKLYRVVYTEGKEEVEGFFTATTLSTLGFIIDSFLGEDQEVILIELLATELVHLPGGSQAWLN